MLGKSKRLDVHLHVHDERKLEALLHKEENAIDQEALLKDFDTMLSLVGALFQNQNEESLSRLRDYYYQLMSEE
mgnify:CR=1 FL=1